MTGVSNAKTLGAAHYPELCMAWLMSQDENYTSSPTEFDGMVTIVLYILIVR